MADFNLGRLKFKWRGDWAINTQYLIDDITKYGGLTFVCIENHTSGNAIANFYTDSAKWNEHTQGLLVTGAWVASSFYKVNDVFQKGSNQYRVTTQHTSPAVFDPAASEIEVLLEGGFEWSGVWNIGTVYVKGQTVRYGGSTYVCVATTTAGDLPTDTTKFAILTSGLKWRGVWSGATAYLIDDVVNHNESSYVLVVNTDTGTTPGTNSAIWNVVSQGDPQAVLTTQGDLLTRNATQHVRLATGSAGQYLKSDGTDPSWSNLDPDAFPSQTGKDGWILTTDGTNVVWSDVINSAPAALDTLNELAASLADDADFAGTMTTALAGKEPTLTAGTTTQYYRGDKTWQTLTVDPTMGGDMSGTASNAQIAAGAVDLVHMSADSVDSDQYVDGSIDNVHLADNAVGLAEMAGLVRGKIIVGDASGDPSALAMGTSEQVLRVNTAGTDLEYADAVGGAAWGLKTSAYTAVAGDGVMVDTDSSAITITLPISSGPPSLGDFVRVLDATGNAATNNITVARNGNNIQGAAADLTIATNRAAIGLVYVNATEGWVLIEN